MADFNKFDNNDEQNDDLPQGYGAFKIAQKSTTGKMYIDYKNTDVLRRFLTPNGKVQSRKKTGLSAREQRMVANAIKRARYTALLPFTSATL